MLKWFWILAVVVAGCMLYGYRHRVFVRDASATLTRDGRPDGAVQVYANVDGDALLMSDASSDLVIVQHGQPIGVPAPLQCLFHWLCLASAYPAPQIAHISASAPQTEDGHVLSFRDGDGHSVEVKLR